MGWNRALRPEKSLAFLAGALRDSGELGEAGSTFHAASAENELGSILVRPGHEVIYLQVSLAEHRPLFGSGASAWIDSDDRWTATTGAQA